MFKPAVLSALMLLPLASAATAQGEADANAIAVASIRSIRGKFSSVPLAVDTARGVNASAVAFALKAEVGGWRRFVDCRHGPDSCSWRRHTLIVKVLAPLIRGDTATCKVMTWAPLSNRPSVVGGAVYLVTLTRSGSSWVVKSAEGIEAG